MTNRYERMKAQRRMQRRIMLVVEERRLAARIETHAESKPDPDATVEIPLQALPRAVGRVTFRSR